MATKKMSKSDKPSTVTRETPQPEKLLLASVVIARVQIKSVTLIDAKARQTLRGDELPTNLEMSLVVNSSLDTKKAEVSVLVRCHLIGRYKKAATDVVPLEFDAVFRLLYGLDSVEDVTQANVDAFGELNGTYNVWPYWREFVQSMTSRMGMPPLTIPVYRVKSGLPSLRQSQAAARKRVTSESAPG